MQQRRQQQQQRILTVVQQYVGVRLREGCCVRRAIEMRLDADVGRTQHLVWFGRSVCMAGSATCIAGSVMIVGRGDDGWWCQVHCMLTVYVDRQLTGLIPCKPCASASITMHMHQMWSTYPHDAPCTSCVAVVDPTNPLHQVHNALSCCQLLAAATAS